MNFSKLLRNKVFLSATACFIASCASEKTVSHSKVRTGLDKYNNGYSLEKGEHGMMQSNSNKESHFNRQSSFAGARDFSGKDYSKESYRKKRWGGNTGYAAKKYGGNTDGSRFQYSPHYVNRNAVALADGQFYGTGNNTSRYNDSRFASSGEKANEGRVSLIKTGESGYVSSQSTAQPRIISKDDYSKLGINESKRLLGR